MPSILVRNLSPETVELLKAAAKAHRRSLQAEVSAILDEAAVLAARTTDFAKWAADFSRRAGPQQSDSTDLIREDRDSDHGRG